MEIRTVTIELLRVGPRDNQLISPLTQYLGVCGNSPAGQVTLPYERHQDLELLLQELRYTVTDEDDRRRSSKRLAKAGRDIAKILSTIPNVSGSLSPAKEQPGVLTHLRIVISASELAMLPFEASKVPSGKEPGVNWLALARSPVCITRHIRSVSAEGIEWPSKPRILFIAGPDTPLAEHRKALLNAIKPWCKDEAAATEHFVTMEAPHLTDIAKKLHAAVVADQPFTHVHILAHGERKDDNDRYSPVGLFLNNEKGVVLGERLARTLTVTTDQGVRRPVVVTVASCDSDKVSDVRTTDASVAHHLHDQGIPLVIASQFPLSVEGSVLFAEKFYLDQFWGKHPLVSLYDVRSDLHKMLDSDTHDWASLVVYEAFPSGLSRQLEKLRYWQARRAHEQVLNRLEGLVDELQDSGSTIEEPGMETLFKETVNEVDSMSKKLPTKGPFELECAGLRAAGNKRVALASFLAATTPGVPDGWSEELLTGCLRRTELARAEYWDAAKRFIRPSSETVQRKGNLHWMLGQVLSLDVVLGRPIDDTVLTAACFAANIDLECPDEVERAWAHVSQSELALLRLADAALGPDQRQKHADDAISNARSFLAILGRGSEHVFTTSRQFQRYIDCWGNPDLQNAFNRMGVPERPHWHEEHGLVPIAEKVVRLLRGSHWSDPQTNPALAVKGVVGEPVMPAGKQTSRSSNKTPGSDKKTPGASGSPLKKRRTGQVFSVEMLPADNGDCLWIEYGDPDKPRRVLIDCGAKSAASALAERIRKLGVSKEAKFELFVLTHIDSDHITGAIPLFADTDVSKQFKDIWFNGYRQASQDLSIRQGVEFSKMLEDPESKLPWNRAMTDKDAEIPAPVVLPLEGIPPTFLLPDGLSVTLLSPGTEQLKPLGRAWKKHLLELKPKKEMLGRKTKPAPVEDFESFDVERLAGQKPKKDTSVPNGSSIALLLEFEGRSMLLTGDAHAEVLARSIKSLQKARGKAGEKLKLDALKLSHHGSGNATTVELLELLDCPRYLVSSSGNIFYHPDREAIARVILHGGKEPTLCFNYRSSLNELWDESVLKERYRYETVYPSKKSIGLRVLL